MNPEPLNYVAGGRLGDFIQMLYVVNQIYQKTGRKANLYITDNLNYGGDQFTRPLDNLYKELQPILAQQDYINKFEVLTEHIDDFINLNDWRLPHNLIPEKFPWTNLMNSVYLGGYNGLAYEPWIKYPKINLGFKDTVVIHRASYRTTNMIDWEQLIRDNDCVFVGFDQSQYDSFEYKHLLPFFKAENLGDFLAILNACKFYIGNQTAPLSMAHSMGVPKLAELWDQDAFHFIGEEKYFKNFNWVSSAHNYNCLDTINNFIKYNHHGTIKNDISMKSKDEIVIINAIPNTPSKITMLEKQIYYFSKLNLPILVVSGCDIPQHILPTIDYYIVNNDNEKIGKDYSAKMYDAGLNDLAYDHITIGKQFYAFYWPTVNSTITKNIKLGFNMARILNYKRAIYTEDDNIFKDGSFQFLENNMNAIRSGYKFATWIGDMEGIMPMMCTAFFFADINFICENLTLPHMKDDWYDVETTKKYHLHKPYEYVYYMFFKKYDNVCYNYLDEYNKLIENNHNNSLMEFGQMNRRFSEKNLIDTFFTVLPIVNDNNKKTLILLNKTELIPNGGVGYDVQIFYDNIFIVEIRLEIGNYYHVQVPDNIKEVRLNISGYGEKIINCDLDSIKNDGHIVNLV